MMKAEPIQAQSITHKDFDSINFEQASLEAKVFSQCVFTDCVFSQCCLNSTLFKDCRLTECRFEDCDLSHLRLDDSSLNSITFVDCKAMGINWTSARWPTFGLPQQLSFEGCLLDYSVFLSLQLHETRFLACRMHGIDFSEADLKASTFAGSDLAESRFAASCLDLCNFKKVSNLDVDIHQNSVKGATFSLSGALDLLRYLDIKIDSHSEWL